MKAADIREKFIQYFTTQEHQLVPSSALIPTNDPTLLFTNAGMVQFKNVFLGIEKVPYRRAVSIQKCLRAGGKHNDLENVGYTARHHTFFEMLGNFSFGDYFKHEAIHFAWDFLTRVLQLPAEKLWITVYQDDEEAAAIWLNDIGISAERLSRCGEKDNFWSMGDTGPCGPCSEIFYDHGPEIAGGPPGTPDAEGDRYIEIWNLVFMQYNRDKDGQLHPLPKPSVDTGMGLERIAAVVQHVHTNYDSDLFQGIIAEIHHQVAQIDRQHPSLKVISDHIRASAFLISDGVLPGNEGRSYVLRRIIRRAVRHGHKLGLPNPFFAHLIHPLSKVMRQTYPELSEKKNTIEQVLLQEENQFIRTLEQGLHLLQEALQQLKGTIIPGDLAFKLYDTYGFPSDLTQDIAREHGLTVDMEGFNQQMDLQRAQSQASSRFTVDYSVSPLIQHASVFHGYDCESLKTSVALILKDNAAQTSLTSGMKAAIILNETPFYAESGGQVGDKGQIVSDNVIFEVNDTQRLGEAIVHYGELIQGELKLDQPVHALVDIDRREAIRLNHTATHLLHAALKEIIGTHVQQKGSLVDAERARFDFSHPTALTSEQLALVEKRVNIEIRKNHPVLTELMAITEAKNAGAVALFGEKYSDQVRVLSVGEFSKELCGGTHARRTGDLGLFKIIAEYGVASGVRRIELVTGEYALEWINQQLNCLQEAAFQLKTTPAQFPEKLEQFVRGFKKNEKELQQLQFNLAAQSRGNLANDAEIIGGHTVLIKGLEHHDANALRASLDQLKNQLKDAVIVLFSVEGEKINVVAGISKSLIGKVPSAQVLVKELCGKGGGREDMAQGGGVRPANLNERIDQIKALLA